MDAISFRQASWEELEGKWQPLVRAEYHAHYNGMGEEYNGVSTADAKIDLIVDYKEGTRIWTAWAGDRLAGFLVAKSTGDRLLLYDMFVSGNSRRQGIGRRLVEMAIADCRAKFVAAEVNRENEASQGLFQSLQFRRAVTSDWYVLERSTTE